MNKYPNSGILNTTKEKKNDKSPDVWGSITLSDDLIQHIVDNQRAGDVVISLSGWKKTGANGNFVSLKASVPMGQPAVRAPTTQKEKDPWDL